MKEKIKKETQQILDVKLSKWDVRCLLVMFNETNPQSVAYDISKALRDALEKS